MQASDRSMKYQLVLQWPASSIKDYDEMIWVEEALISELGNLALVDGHDAGSGEVNIFLFTDDPNRAFLEIKRVLGSKDFLVGLKAAFRERTGSEYTIIWPPGLTTFSVA
jgi:hypothetical protein